jgi:predicted outer membrane repeat protein
VLAVGPDVHLLIEGLTIAGGEARTDINSSFEVNLPSHSCARGSCVSLRQLPYGGGILVLPRAHVTILRSTIYDNHAVPIADRGASNSNQQMAEGGGIYALEDSSVTIMDSSIINNTAEDRGGGIFARDSNITILSSTMSGNRAQSVMRRCTAHPLPLAPHPFACHEACVPLPPVLAGRRRH